MVLKLIIVITKNLLPCIVLHTVFNGVQSVLLVLQPFLPESLNPMPEAIPEKAAFFLRLFS